MFRQEMPVSWQFGPQISDEVSSHRGSQSLQMPS